jgi:glycosyltransferase involved in cell wall biosynthesis
VGVPAGKISVVYNGIDCSRFPARIDRGRKLLELGVPEGSTVVGIACRLEHEKDLVTWLKAARIIAARVPGAAFLIAGEGSERKALEEFSAALGISGKVHFLGLREDVDQVIAACDLMLFASKYEGISLALLESMASGKAVVTTRVGGNVEVVHDGRNGLLVQPGDENALAAAALRLIGDAAERGRLGDAARRIIRERFSLDRWVREIVGIYEEELGRKSKAQNQKSKTNPKFR